MKKWKCIIGILFVLVFAYFYANISKMNVIYDKNVDNSDYLTTGLIGESKVEQSFRCTEDTLDGIYVKCQILGDVTNVKIKYKLIDETEGNIVARGDYEAKDVQSNKFNKFVFNTVEGCRNKDYTLIIWSESSNETNGIAFYFQPNTQEGTKFVINNNETQGTLIFKTITNRFDLETFCVFLVLVAFIYVFMKFLYKLFK